MRMEDRINKYLSENQSTDYQKIFKAVMKKLKVASLRDLEDDEKLMKKFFNEVDKAMKKKG